jgi:hypothetical protein
MKLFKNKRFPGQVKSGHLPGSADISGVAIFYRPSITFIAEWRSEKEKACKRIRGI